MFFGIEVHIRSNASIIPAQWIRGEKRESSPPGPTQDPANGITAIPAADKLLAWIKALREMALELLI